jgi:hypothetical protein
MIEFAEPIPVRLNDNRNHLGRAIAWMLAALKPQLAGTDPETSIFVVVLWNNGNMSLVAAKLLTFHVKPVFFEE